MFHTYAYVMLIYVLLVSNEFKHYALFIYRFRIATLTISASRKFKRSTSSFRLLPTIQYSFATQKAEMLIFIV